ncbi:hypothetical protein TNCV_1024071 [Trichonephila clavipes]|nr:hypothetical protein TNCV_1024071 [Trichonephila clavipes]
MTKEYSSRRARLTKKSQLFSGSDDDVAEFVCVTAPSTLGPKVSVSRSLYGVLNVNVFIIFRQFICDSRTDLCEIFPTCKGVPELFGLPVYRVPSSRDSTVLQKQNLLIPSLGMMCNSPPPDPTKKSGSE